MLENAWPQLQSIYLLGFIFITTSRQHSLELKELKECWRLLLHEIRDSPVLKKIMLMPAEPHKPAAPAQGGKEHQFQCICIPLLNPMCSRSVPSHPCTPWECQQHSRAVTRAARRWHRTNRNYLKWSFARKRLEASNRNHSAASPCFPRL